MLEHFPFGFLIALAGAAAIGAYAWKTTTLWRLLRHGTRTSGEVVDNVKHEGGDAGPYWEPVIAFYDQDRNRVASEQFLRVDEGMVVGQTVPVVYLKNKPEIMLVFTRWNMVRPLLSDWLLLVMGPTFIAGGVAIITGYVGDPIITTHAFWE